MRQHVSKAAWFAGLAAAVILTLHAAPALAGCGDFNSDGNVTATDALGVLSTAVGGSSCDLVRCDVDGGGSVAATDALIVLNGAVGQSVSYACPSVAISNINQLPRATGPVAGGAALPALVAGLTNGAQTGINLKTLSDATFDSQSSMAACEVSNQARQVFNSAAEADRILCYVQNSFAALSNPEVDIYDGELHTFALDFATPPPGADPEDSGGPSSVRMRLVRNDAGAIVDFEMFMCGDGVANEVQTGYVRQAIDGPDFSMVSINVGEDPDGAWSDSIVVNGGLNDLGQFVGTKNVTVVHNYSGQFGVGYGELGIVQRSDRFSLDGFDASTHSDGQGQGTYSRQMHASVELLDDNAGDAPYDLSLLAVGHGAAKVLSVGEDNWGTWDHLATEGWNGDTTRRDDEAAGELLADVVDAELVAVGDPTPVGFDGEVAYSCDTLIEGVVPIDMELLDAQCSALDLGYEWVNCWNIIQPEPEPLP